MLVLKRGGQIVRELPVCSALVQYGQVGDLAFATCALLGYAGTDWFRTVLTMADRFVLVTDRIHIAQPGLEAGHIEWNCPGKVNMHEGGFRLDQQGIFMDLDSDSGWATQTDVADRSADWKRILDSGAYPYAEFPLKKLIFQMPNVEIGGSLCLSTLLSATRLAEPAYRVRESGPGLVCVDALHSELPDLHMDDRDLSVRVRISRLEVRFDTKPGLPEALHAWSAMAKMPRQQI